MSEGFQSKIISEIIETEKTYLNQLEKLQNFFSKPSLERGLLPSHAHSAIFGQLSAIYQMNSRLLEEILLDKENIGRAFLKFGPFLKVYSSYANNFPRSLEILQKWEKENEGFKAFISATETRPEVQTKLSSLLITPIQRIPRYKLLLEELLKYCDATCQFYEEIEGALKKVSESAKHIDRSVFESQEFSRLLMVQRALKDQQPSIIAPGRKLLKEGILNKVSRKGNGSQARLFFLFSDMLIYTKLPSQNLGHNPNQIFSTHFDLKPNSLECCCMLPLRYCRVKTVFGSSNQGITFRLQCSDDDLLLYSAISSEGEGWMDAIKKATDEALMKRKTLRKASSRRKALRRTPLKSIHFSEDELIKEDNSSSNKESKFPKFFELENLKNHLRTARDCLTPPKPISSQKRKKIQAVRSPKKFVSSSTVDSVRSLNSRTHAPFDGNPVNNETIPHGPLGDRLSVSLNPPRSQVAHSNHSINQVSVSSCSSRTQVPVTRSPSIASLPTSSNPSIAQVNVSRSSSETCSPKLHIPSGTQITSQNTSSTQAPHSPPRSQISLSPPRTQISRSPPRAQISLSSPRTQISRSPPGAQISLNPPRTQMSRSPPTTQISHSPPRTQISHSPPRTQISRSPPGAQISLSPPRTQISRSPPRARYPSRSRISIYRSSSRTQGSSHSPLRIHTSQNNPLLIHSSPTGSFRAPKPISPLAICSWEDGSSPRSDSISFVYQNGVRGKEGSQLTPAVTLKEKRKNPKKGLFSPRKKRKGAKY